MTVAVADIRLSRRADVRFACRFAVLGVVVLGAWVAAAPTWELLRNLTTAAVVAIARLTGLAVELAAPDTVAFARGGRSFTYHVSDECTAVQVMLTYGLAVAAYPTSLRNRFIGAVGVAFLVGLNVVRLVVLAWVGLFLPNAFDDIHLYWWQALYVAGTGLVWFVWASRALETTTTSRPRPQWSWLKVPATAMAVLLAMAALGSWAGAMGAYASALHAARSVVADALWAGPLPLSWQSPHAAAVEYGLLSATVALFLAAPGIDVRRRVRAALLLGVPTTFFTGVALTMLLLTFRLSEPVPFLRVADGTLVAVAWALHLGVALVAWLAWSVREQVRRERLAARRSQARHGATHRLARTVREHRPRTTTWLHNSSPILPTHKSRRRLR